MDIDKLSLKLASAILFEVDREMIGGDQQKKACVQAMLSGALEVFQNRAMAQALIDAAEYLDRLDGGPCREGDILRARADEAIRGE